MVGRRKGRAVAIRRDEQDESFDWQRSAACRGEHAVAFFPPPHFERKELRLARERRAKAICRTCPVSAACLDYALAAREPHGVWGGLNEVERRIIADERNGRGEPPRGRGR
jgi:WhiB family redox-sensing transcriptional regulator